MLEHAFSWYMLTSLSVDEILLLWYMNWSTDFKCLSLKMKMASSCLRILDYFLIASTERLMTPSICSGF